MDWGHSYTNYRVLYGPQAKIDTCNKQIQKAMKNGKFVVNEQFHPDP